MLDERDGEGYGYHDALLGHHHAYLLPAVQQIVGAVDLSESSRSIFDLGCGNGAVAAWLAQQAYDVVGVDPSVEGIEEGIASYPHPNLHVGSAYDNLAATYGQFPIVISLEVVEHVYYPGKFAMTLFDLVAPNGLARVLTPYHGYWKNLMLAATGRMDDHFTALWEYGHIKFWSERTLRVLLEEAGFRDVAFKRVGRIPALAKSMIAIARK